jgi:hypothetical protein
LLLRRLLIAIAIMARRVKKRVDGRGACKRGGRTLPSEVCRATIAGGASGRTVATTTTVGPVNRRPRNCFPTHIQIGVLVAKCLPLTHVDCFKTAFKGKCKAELDANYSWSPDEPTVVKTPVSWIHAALKSTFGGNCVSYEQCSSNAKEVLGLAEREMVGNCFLELVLMDCILKRREPDDGVVANAVADTSPPMKAYDGVECTDVNDFSYRTCIAILPGAGVFYCARERRKESEGKVNSHVPMELHWLRLDLKSTGVGGQWFLPESYVRRLWNVGEDGMCSVWKWQFKREGLLYPGCGLKLRGNNLGLMAFRAKQCRDEVGPRLPPDYICGKSEVHLCVNSLRRKYREGLLLASDSTKRGCRHYVKGFLHRHLPSNVLIVDPRVTNDVDIAISVRVPEEWNAVAAVSTDSVVHVRYLPALSGAGVLLDDVRAHARLVHRQRKGRSVRDGLGDDGAMHPIGSRISLDKSGVMRYVTSSAGYAVRLLARAVKACATLASLSIPAVLRVMQDLENDSGMVAFEGMAGDGGDGHVSHTMDQSVDLANSTHYDGNDASKCFTIWTEDIPGSTEGWYFVLPNVHGKRTDGGGLFEGLAIRLTHGVLVSWDGRLVRHGTSVMEREGHVYGTFYAAKKAIVEHGQRMSAESAKKRKETDIVSLDDSRAGCRRRGRRRRCRAPDVSDGNPSPHERQAIGSVRAMSPVVPRRGDNSMK